MVDARHNGPPNSGNGGWTSGLIAAFITDGAAKDLTLSAGGTAAHAGELQGVPEVTLHKPPPLGEPLTVVPTADGLRVIDSAETVIATARRREADIEPVPPVSHAQAATASENYPGHGTHHFPTCFVCGPQRPDGLRIFPGHLPQGGTAAVFEAPPDIDAVTVWAALDCPGGWTVITGEHPWVLGRMAVMIDRVPKPGEECVVVGREVRRDGRKALVRTTLYGAQNDLCARAEATWIAIPPV